MNYVFQKNKNHKNTFFNGISCQIISHKNTFFNGILSDIKKNPKLINFLKNNWHLSDFESSKKKLTIAAYESGSGELMKYLENHKLIDNNIDKYYMRWKDFIYKKS